MVLTGILSIRDAAGLGYPFTGIVDCLSSLCDNVVVGVDPRFSKDIEAIEELMECNGRGNVHVIQNKWNDGNISAGSEIALQMDRLVTYAREEIGSDWVTVLQADELLHEKDFQMIREFCSRANDTVKGFSTERLYFWKDLTTIRKDWNANLIRIFRPGRFSFLAEGTDKAGMYSGPTDIQGDVVALPYKIYHYSRVGNPAEISKRVRNLDGFFHQDNTLIPRGALEDYDFVPREYDNYSIVEAPRKVEGDFVKFSGTHPATIIGQYE